jgi:hypothetical protein
MHGTVWFSVLVDNADATGVAGIAFNPTAYSDTTNTIQLIGTKLQVTLANTTTSNIATLGLNSVHLLLGKIDITAGNETFSLWADPASLSNLSAPLFTSSSTNFLSALSSLGVISYNTTKSNAGGFLDALILSNSSAAFTDVTGVAPALAGDFDHNGVVDAADYVVWRTGLGTTYTPADFNTWRAHFGQSSAGGSAVPAAVPEPAVLFMLLTAGILIGGRRLVIAA